MSLISPKNFVAPFMNGVHLVAIILVALLFGLFRLTEGTIRITHKGEKNVKSSVERVEKSAPAVSGSLGDADSDQASVDSAADTRRVERPSVSEDSSDLVGELLGNSRKAAAASANAPQKGKEKDLADIERQLGIRE